MAYGILYGQIPSTFYDYDYRETAVGPTPRRTKMNEFLTSYSSEHALLWALLVIGGVAAAAIGFHIFWTVVFWTVASLRGTPGRRREDND
ncbi:uncharacterized protein METZ01_LOCUS59916 [marine metagenome]|uniref:Uncharacterized protein n=1 Tax=marine metagenome TaxID=408172 RepID=A0A381SSR3_9ZZZZ